MFPLMHVVRWQPMPIGLDYVCIRCLEHEVFDRMMRLLHRQWMLLWYMFCYKVRCQFGALLLVH